MSKVTSKLQVTIPKAVADEYGIRPGDDIEWVEAGETIRVVPSRRGRSANDLSKRLELFDSATARRCRLRRRRCTNGSGGQDGHDETVATKLTSASF